MYKIKQIPEDFVVNEVNNLILEEKGEYSYFLLKKINHNTLNTIRSISQKLGINQKNIGFAGNKDKIAVTRQIISIKSSDSKLIEKIEDFKEISVLHVGNGNNEVSLGSHQGNEFFITIRNLEENELNKIKESENEKIQMPNYFGDQRFSKNNPLVGKAIVKKNFKEAIELILESNSDFNNDIMEHLNKNNNDFVGALKKVPFKLLKLFIHAYQSFIFNSTIEKCIKNNLKNEKLPIVGFGTEINDKEIAKIIKEIMEEEKIILRDFIINQIPELSQEGDERDLFINVDGFKLIEQDKDELNKDKFKAKINFYLPKGSYATVFIENLFR
jgi:tRNA pseudouridine13 synthase